MNRTAQEIFKGLKGLFAAILAVCSLAATADDAAPLPPAQKQIDTAISQYLSGMKGDRYSRMNADVQPLDSRLQLQSCPSGLEVEHQPRDRLGGRISLKVTCPEADGWSVRIPATVQLFDSVVVAATSIPSGTQLTDKELQVQEMDVALLYRGYFSRLGQLRGLVAKRPIPAGQVLSPITVNPANLVAKGETVSILAEAPGLSIRATGVAMSDGALGQLVQVKNTKSNKVVEGRVTAPGQIKIAL